ncbi:MORN repeat protein [Trichuris suis]|nr:MORN repeat protein [Trichuris suis]
MEGFGELKTVSNDEWTCVKGQWRNGSLNGLASMEYRSLDSSGSLYEGYYEDNKPEGHGALRTVESLFVGEWKKGVKNGYGVLEKSRTKYLGMWEGDLPNGIGVLVTLDGVCCRGSFVKDSFRAAVYFPSGECLSGSFYGRIQDSVQITSGCLQKCSAESIVADEVTFPSADMKWSDVFRHAYDLLGQSSIEECDTDKAWESLAAYCGKIQCSSPAEKGALLKENLETDIMYKILDYNAPFNEAYFSMVKAYCKLAFCSTYHPLGRLKNGLVDVFNLSYSGTGVHRCLLLDAIQEAKSIFLRFYKYVRILFPSLPSQSDMNNLVSEIDHTTPILSWSLETFSSFICGSILQSIYPNLFTLYVIKNEDSDKVYQSNIRHVNSKSDVLLLDHLGVDREFWPVVFIDTADLDKPSCVSENCENVVACPWTADNLVPITTYVLIRAQIQRLGAELNFIRDFAPSLDDAGEIQYMFTTLQCCYQFLVQSKNIG